MMVKLKTLKPGDKFFIPTNVTEDSFMVIRTHPDCNWYGLARRPEYVYFVGKNKSSPTLFADHGDRLVQVSAESEYRMIKCPVACYSHNDVPVMHHVEVKLCEQDLILGTYRELAEREAEICGYKGPMVVFKPLNPFNNASTQERSEPVYMEEK